MASLDRAPDRFERILAAGSILLLLAMLAAVARGQARWEEATLAVWLHLAALTVTLAVTPILLLRPRGDRLHRVLGWVWAVCLFAAAIVSFAIRQVGAGGFSLIHILSVATLIVVPSIVLAARRHRVAQHRRQVHATVLGALLIAGFFTFPFNRMLGSWLFG